MKYSILLANNEAIKSIYNLSKPNASNVYEIASNLASINKFKSEIFIETTEENTINYYKNFIKDEAFVIDNQAPDLYLMLVPIEVLCNHHFYVELCESIFRKKTDGKTYEPKPIIFITSLNIFRNYTLNDSTNNYEKQIKNLEKRTKYFNLDKRKGVLDNSIWHYYVPIQNFDENKTFENRLNNAINSIKNNESNDLYKTVVAKEYLEFEMRMMKNSYLENIGGGHYEHIAPYVFHSEEEMKFRANQKLKKLCDDYKNAKIDWNVLIVDDYSEKKLQDSNRDPLKFSKKDIIYNVLKEFKSDKDKNNFKFHYTTIRTDINVLEETERLIKDKEKQFDIILLDYLLNENSNNRRDLGSELLLNPKYEDLGKHKGPMGKHWIFPITSFSKAMLDRISAEGISRLHDDWYLFDGADPISNPELFRFNIIKLIELQLKQAITTKKEIIENLIEGNFKINPNKPFEIRNVEKAKYGAFMQKFGTLEYLKLDAQNDSAFAKSVLKYSYKNRLEDLVFYEDTRKLLYLVGNGTQHDKRKIINLIEKIEKQLPKEYQINEDELIKINNIVEKFKSIRYSIGAIDLEADFSGMKIENLSNEILKILQKNDILKEIEKLPNKSKLHEEIIELQELSYYSKTDYIFKLLNSIASVILNEYKNKKDLRIFFKEIVSYTNKL